MVRSPSALRLPLSLALALVATYGLTACEGATEDGALIASALLGPDGGEVSGEGITLSVPAGALTTETELEIRHATESELGAPGYQQSGGVVTLHPEELELRRPAALTFGDAGDRAAVLFRQDGLRIASPGTTAYIHELDRATAVIADEDLMPRAVVSAPGLASSPDAGAEYRDLVHFTVGVAEPSRLSVILTIFDSSGAYAKNLNGEGEGDCGFRLADVTGGSLVTDCSMERVTGIINTAGSTVDFDASSFLAGDLETPVTVGVVVGGGEIAYQAGFFEFRTGS